MSVREPWFAACADDLLVRRARGADVSEAAIHAGALALYHLGNEPYAPPSRGEQAEAVLIAAGYAEPRTPDDGSAWTGDNVIRAAAKAHDWAPNTQASPE